MQPLVLIGGPPGNRTPHQLIKSYLPYRHITYYINKIQDILLTMKSDSLRLALIHYAIAILVITIWLLSGCATEHRVMCRHDAVRCALVMGEYYPVQIARGGTHAQAFVAGNTPADIKWIQSNGDTCYFGRQDNFIPKQTLTVKEYLGNQFEWIERR